MRDFLVRQKGLFQIYWRVGRKEWLVVSTGVLTISALALEWGDWVKVPFVLAALGVIGSYVEFWKLKRESNRYQLVNKPDGRQGWSHLRPSTRYEGWQKYSGRHGAAWYDPGVNRLLSERSFPIEFRPPNTRLGRLRNIPGKYRLPEEVRKFERFILFGQDRRQIIFNATKIRISTDLTVEMLQSRAVTVGRTTYYDSLCTNDLTPLMLQERGTTSAAISGMDIVSNGGILLDLSEADLSNHVGGSTLAFTSDDYFVLQRQTKASRQSPGRFAPAGSGSLDWKDVKGASALADFITAGLARELAEETGIPKTSVIPVKLLGVVRHAHRGGQIEFFGLARLPAEFRDLRTRKGEKLYVFDRAHRKCLMGGPLELKAQIERIREEILDPETSPADVSFPLEMALHLLIEALTERPELVAQALGLTHWIQHEPDSVS